MNVCNLFSVKAEWSQWSPCSATCGNGVRVRVTLCTNIDDKPLDDDCQQILQKSEEKHCYLRDCPGEWYFSKNAHDRCDIKVFLFC